MVASDIIHFCKQNFKVKSNPKTWREDNFFKEKKNHNNFFTCPNNWAAGAKEIRIFLDKWFINTWSSAWEEWHWCTQQTTTGPWY